MTTNPIAAALSMIGAMAIIGYIDNYVVTIAEDAGIWQFHFIRSLMAIPLLGIAVWLGFGTAKPNSWRAVGGRSAFLTAAMVFYFASVAVLPIAEAVAGLFTSPIFVVLISALVLRERIGAVRILAVVIGFAGILLVLRPDAGAFSGWTLVPVAAGFFYAISAIATRTWCRGESTVSMVAGSFGGLGVVGLVGLIVLAVFPLPEPEGQAAFILTGWQTPTERFLFWTVIQAVGSVLAVGLIIRAYQLGEATYVGVFEYSLLVFVSIWAYLLRGEVVDGPAALGICLIVASGITIAVRSSRVPQAAAATDPS